uniref:MARVEL domain-containing protein n=1 Tax=Steinernema glaseri TaxID=37863 RepID=A0A1I7ZQV0_9BILA
MVATTEFAECSVLLALQNEQFFHGESRATVFIVWCISIVWIAFILLLLIGIFCNRPFLIIAHILFSVVWMIFDALLLTALVVYDTFSLPAKIIFIVLIFVAVSVIIEWRCYRNMKAYL